MFGYKWTAVELNGRDARTETPSDEKEDAILYVYVCIVCMYKWYTYSDCVCVCSWDEWRRWITCLSSMIGQQCRNAPTHNQTRRVTLASCCMTMIFSLIFLFYLFFFFTLLCSASRWGFHCYSRSQIK